MSTEYGNNMTTNPYNNPLDKVPLIMTTTISTNQSAPQDLIHEFEFQLTTLPGVWLKTDISTSQSLQAIKSGLLHNQSLSKIRLFTISDDDTTIHYVYDVVAAKQGNNPWSTQVESETQTD